MAIVTVKTGTIFVDGICHKMLWLVGTLHSHMHRKCSNLSCLHPYILTSSHPQTITSSHHHIITSSHPHILTPSDHHIITPSHHHILTPSHPHILTPSHRCRPGAQDRWDAHCSDGSLHGWPRWCRQTAARPWGTGKYWILSTCTCSESPSSPHHCVCYH